MGGREVDCMNRPPFVFALSFILALIAVFQTKRYLCCHCCCRLLIVIAVLPPFFISLFFFFYRRDQQPNLIFGSHSLSFSRAFSPSLCGQIIFRKSRQSLWSSARLPQLLDRP